MLQIQTKLFCCILNLEVIKVREAICPICSSSATEFLANGIRAPWISELADAHNSTYCSLLNCSDCNFSWFTPRMLVNVEDAVYQGYRESRYYEVRHKWEPWYLTSLNNSKKPGTKDASLAVSMLDSLLEDMPDSDLEKVADVGGDEGQFFPTRSKERILVDPSNKPAIEGVLRTRSITDLPTNTQLVLVCCVLPHVANPKSLLMEIRENCPQARVLITVANDHPKLRPFHKKESYRNFLKNCAKNRYVFIMLDLLTGICRQFNRKIPNFGIVKQSEHVNYFSLPSLYALAESLHYGVIKQQEILSGGFGGIRLGELTVILEPTSGARS
jgi:hypothetical protein